MAYHAKGDLDRALADMGESIRLDPTRAFRFQERAEIFLKKGVYPLALADINEAIRLDPTRAFRFHTRAQIHQAAGNLSQTVEDFSEAIRIDQTPRSFRFYDRANVFRELRQYERAIADYDTVLRLEPGNAWAHVDRGRAYAGAGQTNRAKEDFDTALRGDPVNSELAAAVAKEIAALTPPGGPDARPSAGDAAPVIQTTVHASPHVNDTRIALVIGNARYAAASPLRNPGRDAAAVAQTLRSLRFAVVQVEQDLTREETIRVLRRFELLAQKADWAVIYYAGHGLEVNGVNYLIPTDARLETDRDVVDEAIPLDRLLSTVENTRKLRLVILDACRNNPFVRQMKRTSGTRSVGHGLAALEPEGGVLVAFAARHGQIAIDGDGENSPFVRSLIARLQQPNLEISKLFRLVRDDVLAATNRKQHPFVYGSLPGEDFYFNPR